MDAEEPCGIEAALEVGDGLIDAVPAAVDDGIGELVLGDEMRDVIEREKRDAFADAGCDAMWDNLAAPSRRDAASSCSSCGQGGILLPVRLDDRAQAAEFLERAFQLFGFDGLSR